MSNGKVKVNKSTIYSMDAELQMLLRPAIRGGHSTIEMYGTVIDLPKKLDFDTLEEMRSYINTRILGNPHIAAKYGDIPYVRVEQTPPHSMDVSWETARSRTPHRYNKQNRTIYFTLSDTGMSIVAVVHEATHAITHSAGLGGGHDQEFLEAYISIYDVIAGPSMAWAVRTLHDEIARS